MKTPRFGRGLLIGLAIVVGLAIVAGIVRAATPPPNPIPAADIYRVAKASLASTIQTRGTVKARSSVDLSFQTVGVIATLPVKVGDRVHQGQTLATLDASQEDTQVAQATSGVTAAQAQVSVAQGKVDQAKGALAQAQAALQELLAGPTDATRAAAKTRVTQAQTALAVAQSDYQSQQQLYNDRTQQKAQLVAAENAVNLALEGLKTARTNATAQKSAEQQALASAQTALDQAKKTLAQDQTQYGSITKQQVEQAQQTYLNELSAYQSWVAGAYSGQNPYSAPLQADQQIYQGLSQGYTALQQAQQDYASATAAVAQAQAALDANGTSVSQAMTNYQAAEKSLAQAEAQYNDRTQEKQALTAAQNGVAQAKSALAAAQAAYQAAIQPATPQAIQQARANVQSAQAAVSAAESGVQAANAGVATAQAQLQAARVAKSHTVLTAPAAGTVTAVPDHSGETVSPGSPVLTIDVEALQVSLVVSETQRNLIQNGDRITLTVPELPGKTFTGHIFQIYPTPVSGNAGEYEVLATVNQAGGKVQPGMTGNVQIQLGSRARAILVPATALATRNGVTGVYVIGAKGGQSIPGLPANVRFRPVSVGRYEQARVEVVKGLSPGDRILLGEARFFVK